MAAQDQNCITDAQYKTNESRLQIAVDMPSYRMVHDVLARLFRDRAASRDFGRTSITIEWKHGVAELVSIDKDSVTLRRVNYSPP